MGRWPRRIHTQGYPHARGGKQIGEVLARILPRVLRQCKKLGLQRLHGLSPTRAPLTVEHKKTAPKPHGSAVLWGCLQCRTQSAFRWARGGTSVKALRTVTLTRQQACCHAGCFSTLRLHAPEANATENPQVDRHGSTCWPATWPQNPICHYPAGRAML